MVELGRAILGVILVVVLRHIVAVGVRGGLFLHGLSEGQLEAVAQGVNLLHLERQFARVADALQRVVQRRDGLPRDRGLATADVELAVRPVGEAVHAGLELLQERPHRALILAVDLLQLHARDDGVLEIADHELALERPEAVVGDLREACDRARELVGEPHRRRVEARVFAVFLLWRGPRTGVAVELARSDVVQFARGHPRALILGDEHVAVGAEGADAVRLAEAGANRIELLAVGGDAQAPAHVFRIPTSAVPRVGEDEVARLVEDRAIDEGVVAAGVAPALVEALEQVRLAIAVRVREPVERLLGADVNFPVAHREAHRLGQPAREAAILRGGGRTLRALDNPHLARPRADGEVAVGQEVHAADEEVGFFGEWEGLGAEVVRGGGTGTN